MLNIDDLLLGGTILLSNLFECLLLAGLYVFKQVFFFSVLFVRSSFSLSSTVPLFDLSIMFRSYDVRIV